MTDAEAEDEERRLVCQRCQHKIFAVDSLSVPQLHFLVTTLRPKQQQQLAEAQPQPQPQSSASALSPSDTPGAPLGSSDTTSASGGESTDELGHSEPAAGSVSSSLDDSLAGSSSDQVPELQQQAQPQQPSLDDSGSYPPPSLRTSPLDDATVPVKPLHCGFQRPYLFRNGIAGTVPAVGSGVDGRDVGAAAVASSALRWWLDGWLYAGALRRSHDSQRGCLRVRSRSRSLCQSHLLMMMMLHAILQRPPAILVSRAVRSGTPQRQPLIAR